MVEKNGKGINPRTLQRFRGALIVGPEVLKCDVPPQPSRWHRSLPPLDNALRAHVSS